MALSSLDNKSRKPDSAQLQEVLGAAHRRWSDLVEKVSEQCPGLAGEWNFAGAKYGWSLRLKQKDHIIVYLIPGSGVFLAGIVLGAKVVAAARDSLPKAAQAIVDAAPRYAEGVGIRMPVATAVDLRVVLQFVSLKIGRTKKASK